MDLRLVWATVIVGVLALACDLGDCPKQRAAARRASRGHTAAGAGPADHPGRAPRQPGDRGARARLQRDGRRSPAPAPVASTAAARRRARAAHAAHGTAMPAGDRRRRPGARSRAGRARPPGRRRAPGVARRRSPGHRARRGRAAPLVHRGPRCGRRGPGGAPSGGARRGPARAASRCRRRWCCGPMSAVSGRSWSTCCPMPAGTRPQTARSPSSSPRPATRRG